MRSLRNFTLKRTRVGVTVSAHMAWGCYSHICSRRFSQGLHIRRWCIQFHAFVCFIKCFEGLEAHGEYAMRYKTKGFLSSVSFLGTVVLLVFCCMAMGSCSNDDEKDIAGGGGTDLPEAAQNFVGLWEFTFTINRPGHFLFLPNGRGRVEPYTSGIVAGQDDMNGYWAYDAEESILSTTLNYQFNITLSTPDAWAGYRIGSGSECKAKKLDDPRKFLSMYWEMVGWNDESMNLPSSLSCYFSDINMDSQKITASYTLGGRYEGTIEISGYSSDAPQLTINNNHSSLDYFKAGTYSGTFVD